jgi:hypothetical protein
MVPVVLVEINREHENIDQARLGCRAGNRGVVVAEANEPDATVVPVPFKSFDPLHRPVLPQRLGIYHGEHGDLSVAVSQTIEGLIKTALAAINRFVVDESPVEAEH